MRVLRGIGWAILAVFLLYGGAWLVAPREPVDEIIAFDANNIGPDVDAYLAAQELQFPDLLPELRKKVTWQGAPGVKTALSVVYLHGWSSSGREIHPVAERLARDLGANLFVTRLSGHGLGPQALAVPDAGQFIEDLAEALAVGRRIGERVIVLATSTGGTLAVYAATRPDLAEGLAGMALISPNLGMPGLDSWIVRQPFARQWVPLIEAEHQGNHRPHPDYARYWTTHYPIEAVFPLEALVRRVAARDMGQGHVPLLVFTSAADKVVDPSVTHRVLAGWGGPVTWQDVVTGPEDDPFGHVLAGDIASPGQTDAVLAAILAWAGGL